MVADGLATKGDCIPAAITLTKFAQNIPALAPVALFTNMD